MTSLAIATAAAASPKSTAAASWSRIEERIWKGHAHFPGETPKLLRAMDRARRAGLDPSGLWQIGWADQYLLRAGGASALIFKASEGGRSVTYEVSDTEIDRSVFPTPEEFRRDWVLTVV